MAQPTKTEAIKNFLLARTHQDLAALYNHDLEVQVNVAQDGGERVDGEFKGRQWHGFSDGITTWKPIRIPYKAKTDPEYTDTPIQYDLAEHVEGIGMTGWDWKSRVSRWVGFDFDAMTGHSERHTKKLSDAELKEVVELVSGIPWVTVRKSTSGKGLHLYVFLQPFPTQNHDEHAAVARSILGIISGIAGVDFSLKVDACGGNMWVWHRKMKGTDGLSLIKPGILFNDIPSNWRDHLNVIRSKRAKILPEFVEESDVPDAERIFEELTGQRSTVKLDNEHKQLITWLGENDYPAIWDADHHMLITHTFGLAQAHDELSLRGTFKTNAEGTERGDHNCFSGDTEILTDRGPVKFRDARPIERLYVRTDTGFHWMDCEIRSFGFQKTVPIYFGDGSTCRATANHQWLYRDGNTRKVSLANKKFTYELVPYKTQLPLSPIELPDADDDYWRGYAHGFVFGDGWEVNPSPSHPSIESHCDVALFKRDVDLKRVLLRFGTLGSQYYEGSGYVDVIRNLPAGWKSLPKNASKSYALGFVLGFGSADANVSRQFTLFQSDWNDLREIQKLAIYAGLRTNPIRPFGDGNGFKNGKQGYACTINTYNLTKEHFLRSDQARTLTPRTKNLTTTVSWIDWEAAEREKVYCAVVPFWQNFTLANGVNCSNCFAFPMRRGSWAVRRYSPGCAEDPSWDQDGAGYTRCYFNRDPDLQSACRSSNGNEHPSGGFHFRHAEQAIKAGLQLGADIKLPVYMMSRTAKLKEKDKRLVVEVGHETTDNPNDMQGWIQEGKKWTRVFSHVQTSSPVGMETGNYDDLVRHVVTETGDDYGWVLQSDNQWRTEPLAHVKVALEHFDLGGKEVKAILGGSVFKPWTLVNRPFQPEYPGDRTWNRGAAQFRFHPTSNTDSLHYEHWTEVLNHIGRGLDDAVKENGWCRANGIITGADYLKVWIASLFQEPGQPLPYLFLYSPEQNTGKSILHEALSHVITHGIARADAALINQSGFNGELENAVLCVVEETDLKRNKAAYNRIKDWVTSRHILIHKKGRTPYNIPNTTHWIQCANDHTACPIFQGDTRITMIRVQEIELDKIIPKKVLLPLLEKEAPDFLAEMLSLEIPNSNDRLNVPVIATEEKIHAASGNKTYLEMFIEENCHLVPGKMIPLGQFYERFKEWLDPQAIAEWTKIRVGKEMPPHIPKGRKPEDGQWHFGNISWVARSPSESILPKLVVRNELLVPLAAKQGA